MTIRAITKNFLNLIYPVHCHVCRKHLDASNEYGICDFCRSGIRRAPMPQRLSYSACIYEGSLKELIHQFKYNGKVAHGRLLAGLMIDFLKANPEIIDGIDLMTFVPLHNSRMRERGFNQSRILAFHISKAFDIKLTEILEKSVKTKHQNELSRDGRLSNLKGAFRIKKNAPDLTAFRILLIDDVTTTGATAGECARTLLRTGAKEVRPFTLAKGI